MNKNYTQIRNEITRSGKAISCHAYRVFGVISSFNWGNAEFPSFTAIMKMSGLSRDTVGKAIHELERLGLIVRRSGQAAKVTNGYIINPPTLWGAWYAQPAPSTQYVLPTPEDTPKSDDAPELPSTQYVPPLVRNTDTLNTKINTRGDEISGQGEEGKETEEVATEESDDKKPNESWSDYFGRVGKRWGGYTAPNRTSSLSHGVTTGVS